MRYILIIIFFCFVNNIIAQDTIIVYYDTNWVEIPTKENAVFYRKAFLNANKQWETHDYFKSNKIQMIGFYKSKKFKSKEGHFTYFYENGNRSSEGDYKKDVIEGEWKYWYEDGTLRSEGINKQGLREGKWKFYSQKGLLLNEEIYKNGVILSVFSYFENGQILLKGNFKNGLRDGEWQFFNIDGRVFYKCNFAYGRENGLGIRYFKDGSEERINFVNGISFEKKYGGSFRVNAPN